MSTNFITLEEHERTQKLLAAFRASKPAEATTTFSLARPEGATALTEQMARAIEGDIKAAQEQTPEQIQAETRRLLGMSPIGRAALSEAHTVGFSAKEVEAYSAHDLATFSGPTQTPGAVSPEVRKLLEMSALGRKALKQQDGQG